MKRRTLISFLFGLIATLTIVGHADHLPNGIYYILPHKSNQFLLDNDANRDVKGNGVHLWESTGASNQKWYVENLGNNRIVLRRLGHRNLLLDNRDNRAANGNQVFIWERNGCGAQIWIPENRGDNYYTLRNGEYPNYALDWGGEYRNGGIVHLWEYSSGNVNQIWRFIPIWLDGLYFNWTANSDPNKIITGNWDLKNIKIDPTLGKYLQFNGSSAKYYVEPVRYPGGEHAGKRITVEIPVRIVKQLPENAFNITTSPNSAPGAGIELRTEGVAHVFNKPFIDKLTTTPNDYKERSENNARVLKGRPGSTGIIILSNWVHGDSVKDDEDLNMWLSAIANGDYWMLTTSAVNGL